MEVGAVKQAFNNEVIQLKRSVNQAKIQTIHKLTRKAKTFAEKKTPEKLKEKLKRKAESAVNEVLLIKKIKPRDIARFIVTHTGNLEDYLNKPTVDQDKACARLLLHKSLQGKYKSIRTTFSGIPIKDLLMSRQERRKLKREALLDNKMKKDKKLKVVNAEGDWDVETVKPNKMSNIVINKNTKINESDISEDDEEMELDRKADSDHEAADSDAEEANSDDEENEEGSDDQKDSEDNRSNSADDDKVQSDASEAENEIEMESDQELGDNAADDSKNNGNIGKFVKPCPAKESIKDIKNISSTLTFEQLGKNRRKPDTNKPSKPKDIHKNKNLNEKLQTRKFKKGSRESQVKETKVVDPFFITSTGENYMSVAEPRQPDEVKEIHKQGNRKERRAAMFGHVPKVKPRQIETSGFRNKSNHSDENYSNNYKGNNFRNKNDKQFRGKNDQWKDRNDNAFDGRNNKFKRSEDKNDSKFKGKHSNVEPKVEKLHPSWEAKKKQSGILPFQGKKILFDEG